VLAIALVTVGLLPLRDSINTATVALIQLLVVVLVATFLRRRAAITASVLAALSFNFFFLPPYYTLSIYTAQDWVAMLVFLAVALMVGHLSAMSNRRRVEAERLYKELEDAFEKASHTEALKRSEKLKTSLLDAVTHDFRTPLTSIKASATMLIEDRHLAKNERTLDSHSRGELLDVINEETDKLNTFVESMVELARFEAGETELQRSAVTAEEIVVKAARRARSVRPTHKLESQVEPGLPTLSVDSRALVEAVYNLIDNAAKYSPAGTTIHIGAENEHGDVRFSVEDEGPGIPESERGSVFERFYRGGLGVAREKGLGMGLAIVRGIIEAHGGKIWVESGKRGARFVFDLPANSHGR